MGSVFEAWASHSMAPGIWGGASHECVPRGLVRSQKTFYDLASAIPECPILTVKRVAKTIPDSRRGENNLYFSVVGRHGHTGKEELIVSHLGNKLPYVAFVLAIHSAGMILLKIFTWPTPCRSQFKTSAHFQISLLKIPFSKRVHWPLYLVTFSPMAVFNYFHSNYHSKINLLLGYLLQSFHNYLYPHTHKTWAPGTQSCSPVYPLEYCLIRGGHWIDIYWVNKKDSKQK